jgi:hypothetical protein
MSSLKICILKVCFICLLSLCVCDWTRCADEGQHCNVSAAHLVRFGTGESWVQMVVDSPGVSCSTKEFGSDPGVNQRKGCEVDSKIAEHEPLPIDVVSQRELLIPSSLRCKFVSKKTALMGILLPASKFTRRKLIRDTYLREKPSDIDVFFVCCHPKRGDEHALMLEIQEKRDIVVMDCVENVMSGKTYDWFAYAYKNLCPYKFVMKCDDDTFVHLPNLRRDLAKQHTNNVYYGRPCTKDYQPMCGALYGMSWNLVEFVATNEVVATMKNGQEDFVTFEWMNLYGRATSVAKSLEEFHDHPRESWTGWSKPFSSLTIAVHQCKLDVRLLEAYECFFGGSVKQNDCLKQLRNEEIEHVVA